MLYYLGSYLGLKINIAARVILIQRVTSNATRFSLLIGVISLSIFPALWRVMEMLSGIFYFAIEANGEYKKYICCCCPLHR